MRKTNKNANLNLITLVALIASNLLHFFLCFLPLFIEQIKIGKGTNIEILAVALWLYELILLLLLGACLIAMLFRKNKKENKKNVISILSLISILIVQIILTNIFIFY